MKKAIMKTKELRFKGSKIIVHHGGKGPALLLLHGAWAGAKLHWSPVWDRLAGRFLVIAPDLPGFGGSAPLKTETADEMVEFLHYLCDEFKIKRVTVVGNSFGGGVGQVFASRWPEMVEHLILVDAGLINMVPGPVRALLRTGPMQKVLTLLLKTQFTKKALEKAFHDIHALDDATVETIVGGAQVPARITKNLIISTDRPVSHETKTSLVWGTDDNLVALKKARRIASMFRFPLHTVSNAGHLPQLENPEEFIKILFNITGTA
jgi:pimeloyl-ACP methyl ester carboxylesterase